MRCLCLLRCSEGRGTNLTEVTVGLAEPGSGVTLEFSRPGKPTENGSIHALNPKLRAECLNADCFMSLADAHERLVGWRRDCPALSRWRNRPVTMIGAGKLQLPPVQTRVLKHSDSQGFDKAAATSSGEDFTIVLCSSRTIRRFNSA